MKTRQMQRDLASGFWRLLPSPVCCSRCHVENTYVGPFLIIKKLGRNRRQKVYHARQTEQDRDVALKFISIPPTIEWVKALDKIEREVNELQKLRHKNLVTVYGAGVSDDNRIFFATELVEGESLTSILSRRGKLTTDLVVEYGQQIAEVLRYLHSLDLIHSKLTPEKILITPDHKIKISDLRLNRSKRRRWDATKHRKLDIAAYMAPEQFAEGATRKSDFYSLGVILFEMLTGKLPYPPDTMGRMKRQKLNAPVPSVATHLLNCPIWLDKIVSQMLSPNPKKRPHSARAISMAFDEIKNIDATKKAAVSQMSGGFNPLTAGQDKTEAQQLLGMKKKKTKKKREAELPFHKQVPFQVAALVAILAFTVFMLIPKSHQKIVEEVKTMVASPDSSKWNEARVAIEPVMNSDGPLAEQAEGLYYQSFRKSLVYHAEQSRSTRLDSENVQLFAKAVRFERNDDASEAVKIYGDLVAKIDPDGKERHIYDESQARLRRLSKSEELPRGHDKLGELISKARNSTPDQLDRAHDLLVRIQLEFAGEAGYEEIVSQASTQLEIIKRRIADGNQPVNQSAEQGGRAENGNVSDE